MFETSRLHGQVEKFWSPEAKGWGLRWPEGDEDSELQRHGRTFCHGCKRHFTDKYGDMDMTQNDGTQNSSVFHRKSTTSTNSSYFFGLIVSIPIFRRTLECRDIERNCLGMGPELNEESSPSPAAGLDSGLDEWGSTFLYKSF